MYLLLKRNNVRNKSLFLSWEASLQLNGEWIGWSETTVYRRHVIDERSQGRRPLSICCYHVASSSHATDMIQRLRAAAWSPTGLSSV